MVTFIVVRNGDGEIRYPVKSSITNLGRALDNDIVLSDVRASRKHCQILYTKQGFKVVDLGSNNGIRVNETKVSDHVLAPGDVIQIGSTEISLVSGSSPGGSAAGANQTTTSIPPIGRSTPPPPRPPASDGQITTTRAAAAPTVHSDSAAETGQARLSSMRRSAGGSGRFKQTTLKNSMTSKVILESKRKKLNPWLKMGIVAGGIVVVAVLVYAIVPSPVDVPKVLGEIKNAEEQAMNLVNKKKYKEGIERYQRILNDYGKFKGKHKDIKETLSYIDSQIKGAQELQAREQEAVKEVARIEKLIEENTADSLRQADDLVNQARAKYKGTAQEKILNKQAGRIKEKTSALTRLSDDFQGVITQSNKSVYRKEFGGAVKIVKTFLQAIAGEAETDQVKKIREEAGKLVEQINKKARDQYEFEYRAAKNMLEVDGKKADAVKHLKKWVDNFEGTDVQPDLEKAIKDFESR